MYRNALEELVAWKNKEKRKPMVIRGARQVGKTWLMRTFAESEYEHRVYIDMSNNERMRRIFAGDYNIDRIINELSIYSKQKIGAADTLLIFDEIQENPKALTALKYFNENAPAYQIVCAGSLLGVALHEGTSFPVGQVEFMDLHPLSFGEFMIALGNERFAEIADRLDFEMMSAFKQDYISILKQYFLLGGMPAVVSDFLENKDYASAGAIQDGIIAAYDQDISKHAPNNQVPRTRWLWESIPRQLSKENKKFVYGQIKEGARGKDYEFAMLWLMDTGLVHRVNRLSEIKYPLKPYEDLRAFKLYACDVGLLARMSGIDESILLDGNDLLDEFKGALTEQYVLQELVASKRFSPYYWSNMKGDAEIDFIIQAGTDIIPIEVKAGINPQAKGLKYFMQKHKSRTAVRTSLADHKISDIEYDADTQGKVIDVPLYAFGAFQRSFQGSMGHIT